MSGLRGWTHDRPRGRHEEPRGDGGRDESCAHPAKGARVGAPEHPFPKILPRTGRNLTLVRKCAPTGSGDAITFRNKEKTF